MNGCASRYCRLKTGHVHFQTFRAAHWTPISSAWWIIWSNSPRYIACLPASKPYRSTGKPWGLVSLMSNDFLSDRNGEIGNISSNYPIQIVETNSQNSTQTLVCEKCSFYYLRCWYVFHIYIYIYTPPWKQHGPQLMQSNFPRAISRGPFQKFQLMETELFSRQGFTRSSVFLMGALPWKLTNGPWQSTVGRCIPYCNSPFLADMLVLMGVFFTTGPEPSTVS